METKVKIIERMERGEKMVDVTHYFIIIIIIFGSFL